MPFYKDATGNLHFLESVDFEHLLPAGSVPINDAEAAAIQAPKPLTGNALIDSQIAALESIQVKSLTPRAIREFYLGLIAAFGQNPALNPGTAALADVQAQIVALRKQRT